MATTSVSGGTGFREGGFRQQGLYPVYALHSALGYVAPLAFMAGQAPAIWAERDRKLEAAREQRRQRRQQQAVA